MTFLKLLTDRYLTLKDESTHSLVNRTIHNLKYKKKMMSSYEIYLKQNMNTDNDLNHMRSEIKTFKYKPHISIITPVYNVDSLWLEKAIDSIINQVYENWELCLVDDASTKEHIKKTLEAYSEKDPMIKVKYLSKNQGISGASNDALSMASGEFAGFLDHDDELTIDALYEMTKLLQKYPEADMIYSDEDHITTKGSFINPYFKPDWSPDLFLSSMYTCHFGVYRKKLIDEIGGFRKGFEGSQDYDLVLRLTERTDKIFHIPKILYHWRSLPGSTALKYQAKGYADINARKALEEALNRRNIRGNVLTGKFPGTFRVKREITGDSRLSIIILVRDNGKNLKKCIDSIKIKTSYKNYEILVVNNKISDNKIKEDLNSLASDPVVKIINYPGFFNNSAFNNFAAKNTKSQYLLFLNENTEVISEDWLSAMLEHAQRKEVGAVGCKLLNHNNTVQHAGLILGISQIPHKPGIAGYSHRSLPNSFEGYFKRPHVIHNLSAITGACAMIRTEVFEEVGGFDENLDTFNDIDLCLKIREKGYLIIYTPYAELYLNRSDKEHKNKQEQQLFLSKDFIYVREKWGKIIDTGDPYYNPNLAIDKEDFSIRIRKL